MTLLNSTSQTDPQAIQFLDHVIHQVNPNLGILLGSRARGDWKSDSDLDLLLVNPEPTKQPDELETMVNSIAAQTYYPDDHPPIQIIQLNYQDFKQSLESINGIAARACREGIVRTTLKQPVPQWDPNQTHQEAVQTNFHCNNAATWLKTFQRLAKNQDLQMPATQMLYLAYNQALLAASSAAGIEYNPKNTLPELAETLAATLPEVSFIADSPRLQMLEDLKANSYNAPIDWPPFEWTDHIEPVNQEINLLVSRQ